MKRYEVWAEWNGKSSACVSISESPAVAQMDARDVFEWELPDSRHKAKPSRVYVQDKKKGGVCFELLREGVAQ